MRYPARSRTAPGSSSVVSPAQRIRLQHPGQPEIVIRVEVREVDLLELHEPDIRAQELALRSLCAVEQKPVTTTSHERRRQGALGRGHGAGRPEENDVEVHGRGFY